jgi:hypothetical protein
MSSVADHPRVPSPSPWRRRAVLVLLWAAGLAFFTWASPVGPREGWELPKGEEVLGFLKGGQTLVTYQPLPSPLGGHPRAQRPGRLHLREAASGKLLQVPETSVENEAYLLPGTDSVVEVDLKPIASPAPKGTPQTGSTARRGRGRITVHNVASGKTQTTLEFTTTFTSWSGLNYSPDGTKLALKVLNDKEERVVRTYDLQSGHILSEVPLQVDGFVHMFFLYDNRRLAIKVVPARDRQKPVPLSIYNAETGALVLQLPPTPLNVRRMVHTRFSSYDVKRIIDGDSLFDSTTGIKLCDLPHERVQFSPTDDTLFSLEIDGHGPYLAYYDGQTGRELSNRRHYLSGTALSAREWAYFVNPENRLLLVVQEGTTRTLPAMLNWVVSFPGLGWVNKVQPVAVLVDYPTQRIVGQLRVRPSFVSYDGTFCIARGPDSQWQLWDVPARRPRVNLLLSWSAWSLFYWLVQNRVVQARRRAGPT